MPTYFTPIVATPNQIADADTFNDPMLELDAGIGIAYARGDDALSIAVANDSELSIARDTYASLDARLDAIGYASSGVATWTLTNGAAAAAQKVVTVVSTVGFIAGAYVVYTRVGGTVEYNAIATVDSATQLTLQTNIGTGGIATATVIAMTAVFTQTTPGGILVPQISVGTHAPAVTITTADAAETDFAWVVHTEGLFNGVYDTEMNIGYNVSPSGGRIDASKAAAYWTIEGTYQYSPTLSRTEMYIEMVQTAAAGGATLRPWAVNFEHQSNVMACFFTGTEFNFLPVDTVPGNQITYNTVGASGALSLVNVAMLGSVNDLNWIRQLNAAGNAFRSLIKLNAADRIVVGGDALTVYTDGSIIADGSLQAGGGGYEVLGTALTIANQAVIGESTYRHEIRTAHSAGGTLNLMSFGLCDGTASGHKTPLVLRGDNRAILGAPSTTIEDAGLAAGNISFWLDEAGNTLTVKAKYSGGTVKSGTVALA